MPIPLTKLHENRLLEQVIKNLIGLQADILRNAKTHRTMALAQSPPIATLQNFVVDSITQYQRRLQWVADVTADSVRRQKLIDALTRIGCAQADATDIYNALNTVVSQMNAANKSTFAAIVSLCDNVIANVDMPESLWPE